MNEQNAGRFAFRGYLVFAALLVAALAGRYEQGWGLGLLLAGAPWTFIVAVALDGVGLVRLPFVVAWESVLALLGAGCVLYNAAICYALVRRAARFWRRVRAA